MILSDLPSPAEAATHKIGRGQGFAQAGNGSPIAVKDMLFGIMRYASRAEKRTFAPS